MTARDLLSGRSIASGVASHIADEAGKHSYPKPALGDTGKHTGHYLVIRGRISRGRGGKHAVRELHVAYEHPKQGEINFGAHGEKHPILGRIPLVHDEKPTNEAKESMRERLVRKYAIDHTELAEPEHTVHSIGYSSKNKKWYGWSHRAISGFKTKEAAKRFARSVS